MPKSTRDLTFDEFAAVADELKKRIEAAVEKGGDGCWRWTRTRMTSGYGEMSVGGKKHGAHRLAFVLWNRRPIKAGRVVCHSCDVRECCNPEHLRVGTYADNYADRRLNDLCNPPPPPTPEELEESAEAWNEFFDMVLGVE